MTITLSVKITHTCGHVETHIINVPDSSTDQDITDSVIDIETSNCGSCESEIVYRIEEEFLESEEFVVC